MPSHSNLPLNRCHVVLPLKLSQMGIILLKNMFLKFYILNFYPVSFMMKRRKLLEREELYFLEG